MIEVIKTQANGAGYLVLPDTAQSDADVAPLARALCDLQGTVGGEGLVRVATITPSSISATPYSPDGTADLFSVNAIFAAALHQHELHKGRTVQVYIAGLQFSTELRPIGNDVVWCEVSGLTYERLGDEESRRLLSRLVHQSGDGVAVGHRGPAGRIYLSVLADRIDDGALQVMAESFQDAAGGESDVVVSMLRPVGEDSVFVRSFAPHGGGLVTSCTGAVAAGGLAIIERARLGAHDEPGGRTVQAGSLGGIAVVNATMNRSGPSSVRVSARVGRLYHGQVEWRDGRLGSELRGTIDMDAFVRLQALRTAELESLRVADYYQEV